MIETFKSRLKAKFPGVNLSQKRIDAIAERLNKKFPDLSEEKDHDEKIDALYDEDEIKEIAKQDDQIRTLEAKSKEKPKEEPKQKEEEKKDDDIPAWFKAYKEENDRRFSELKAKEDKASIGATLKEKLKEVPEKFWSKRVQPEKIEDIDAFVTEVTTDYSEFAPKNPGFQPGKPSGKQPKPSEKEVNSLVDDLMGIVPKNN